MIDPAIATLVLGVLAESARRIHVARSGGQSESASPSRRSDQTRSRTCEQVLRAFLRRQGFLAQAVAKPGELRRLIEDGIEPGQLRQLLQRRAALAVGILVGHQRIGRRRVPVRIPLWLWLRSIVIAGKMGTGKTTLQRHMVLGHAAAGAGVFVLVHELEFVFEEILPFLQRERWRDVVLIDPRDFSCPVPFNPLHLESGEDPDLKVAHLQTILKRACGEEGSTGAPRMENILGEALDALVRLPGTTLLDIERLLDRQDDGFRRYVIEHCTDERARRFWSLTYEAYPRDAHLSLVNRLGKFLRPRAMRNLLCQPGPSFSLRRAMDEGKIVFVLANDGVLGEDNANLVGQLYVAQLQLAAMSRADQRPDDRRPFFAFIDEFQRIASASNGSFEQIFSRSRKYGLSMCTAFQHFGQIPESVVRDLLGTIGSVISFAVGGTDARRLSRELVAEESGRLAAVDPGELVSLPLGQAVCRLGRTLLRLEVLPPPEGGNTAAREEIIRLSRESYGRPATTKMACEFTHGDFIDPKDVF